MIPLHGLQLWFDGRSCAKKTFPPPLSASGASEPGDPFPPSPYRGRVLFFPPSPAALGLHQHPRGGGDRCCCCFPRSFKRSSSRREGSWPGVPLAAALMLRNAVSTLPLPPHLSHEHPVGLQRRIPWVSALSSCLPLCQPMVTLHFVEVPPESFSPTSWCLASLPPGPVFLDSSLLEASAL